MGEIKVSGKDVDGKLVSFTIGALDVYSYGAMADVYLTLGEYAASTLVASNSPDSKVFTVGADTVNPDGTFGFIKTPFLMGIPTTTTHNTKNTSDKTHNKGQKAVATALDAGARDSMKFILDKLDLRIDSNNDDKIDENDHAVVTVPREGYPW